MNRFDVDTACFEINFDFHILAFCASNQEQRFLLPNDRCVRSILNGRLRVTGNMYTI